MSTAAVPTTSSTFGRRIPVMLIAGILLAGSALIILPQLMGMLFAEASLGFVTLLTYVVYAAVWIAVLRLLVRPPRPTATATGLAFLWGLVVVPVLQTLANPGWADIALATGGVDFFYRWAPAISAPVTEELAKAAGVVAVLAMSRRRPLRPSFGFFVGAVVGVGFMVIENVDATLSYASESGASTFQAWSYVLLNRALLLGIMSHAMYTGIFGLALGYAITRTNEARTRRVLVAVGGFLFAMVAHFVNNSYWLKEQFPESPIPNLIKGLPFFVVAVLCVILMVRSERRPEAPALTNDQSRLEPPSDSRPAT